MFKHFFGFPSMLFFLDKAMPIVLRQSVFHLASVGFELVAWSGSPRRSNANEHFVIVVVWSFVWDFNGIHDFRIPNYLEQQHLKRCVA